MDSAKKNAAEKALGFVKDGMVVGLGSGSTAAIFIALLGALAKRKRWKLSGVPTSEESRAIAVKAGIRVIGLEDAARIDVAVDGADEVDAELNLIKGGGGALTREKIVDYAAKKLIVVVDGGKMRKKLSGWVPIEVVPFAMPQVARALRGMGAKVDARRKGTGLFVTDNGNQILDARFGMIPNPARLELELRAVPGIVENGIFSRKRPVVVIGGKGGARILKF